MSRKMAPTPIIQNAIPVRYDPRVVVKPCEPERVPHLPVEILYQIAKALPQPKQIYNLAIACRDSWDYLQPALYESEVTYEARLAQRYHGQSSTSLCKRYPEELAHLLVGSQGEEDTASTAELSPQEHEFRCPAPEESDECDGRISLEKRVFEIPMPKLREDFRVSSAMTALHWASTQGTSALPVARKVILAALTHQPSYINGLDLIERQYRMESIGGSRRSSDLYSADLPPPLFLAVVNGNLELCKVLIDAGCDLSLMRGPRFPESLGPGKTLMIHKKCIKGHWSENCVCSGVYSDYFWFLACQNVGHVAIEFGQTEILEYLLQCGLTFQQEFCSLIHYAVVHGNLAAVKTLLDHDPSLINPGRNDKTPMHVLHYTMQTGTRDFRDGKLKDMVSCLVERGANLDARSAGNVQYPGEIGTTPLQSALKFATSEQIDEPQIITALHAAQVLIHFGADWTQLGELVSSLREEDSLDSGWLEDDESDEDADALEATGSNFLLFRIILDFCIEQTVILIPENHDEYDFDWNRRCKIRQAWGHFCKTLITKVSESLSQDKSDLDRAAFDATISSSFARLVINSRRSMLIGGWARQTIGNLLLSTGIKPVDKVMKNWEEMVLEDGDLLRDEDEEETNDERLDDVYRHGVGLDYEHIYAYLDDEDDEDEFEDGDEDEDD